VEASGAAIKSVCSIR